MNKHYYTCIRKTGDTITTDIWHCTQPTASNIAKAYDFIVPLDRKPRKAEVKEG